ncbi:hypothetical protein C8F04DRAFT_1390757 [Mycena alexandri]|uniref:Uncharacterized protein n=1 Tax=Mycena alexandri TaxID=1745969 RepID=A0AAD6TBI0_9AGAR|nr:hypothetical protein C8F04DRAFT_1390757 [Mycena alexandri]
MLPQSPLLGYPLPSEPQHSSLQVPGPRMASPDLTRRPSPMSTGLSKPLPTSKTPFKKTPGIPDSARPQFTNSSKDFIKLVTRRDEASSTSIAKLLFRPPRSNRVRNS